MPARPCIALIHQSPSCIGASFPDLPGITTAADTLDEAMTQAEVLALAFEDWTPPAPRGLDKLLRDAGFAELAEDAIVAVVRPGGEFA